MNGRWRRQTVRICQSNSALIDCAGLAGSYRNRVVNDRMKLNEKDAVGCSRCQTDFHPSFRRKETMTWQEKKNLLPDDDDGDGDDSATMTAWAVGYNQSVDDHAGWYVQSCCFTTGAEWWRSERLKNAGRPEIKEAVYTLPHGWWWDVCCGIICACLSVNQNWLRMLFVRTMPRHVLALCPQRRATVWRLI